MNGQIRTFRRPDTGERRDFALKKEEFDTSDKRFVYDFLPAFEAFFQADDRYRIDEHPDGSFRDGSGVLWLPDPK
jgi:hypothetical protein